MRQVGTVVGMSGSRVLVTVKRTETCDRCGKCSHAHISFGNDRHLTVEALPLGELQPGDLVELELGGRDYLRLSFLVYLLPLLGGAIGLALGHLLGATLGNPGIWGGVCGLGSVAATFLWLHAYDKAASKSGRYLPLARPLGDLGSTYV